MGRFDTFRRKCERFPHPHSPVRRTPQRRIRLNIFNACLHRKIPLFIEPCRQKSKFGFFVSEEESYRKIATELGLIQLSEQPLKYARHPLVYLVEAADDICYQMMDIEDAHKLKDSHNRRDQRTVDGVLQRRTASPYPKTFHIVNDINEQIAYLRSSVIGLLIRECTRVFWNTSRKYFPALSKEHLSNISPNVRQPLTSIVPEVSLKKNLPLTRCTGHRVSRLPDHQYPCWS